MSHVAPFLSKLISTNVKYFVVIDLTILYITINGDLQGLISEMSSPIKTAKCHLNKHKNIRNTEVYITYLFVVHNEDLKQGNEIEV